MVVGPQASAVTRSRLLLAIAGVLAGAAVLFVVLGAVFNLLLVVAAVPFGLAAYFLWSDATGRLQGRIRRRVVDPGGSGRARTAGDRASAATGRRSTRWPRDPERRRTMDREEALAALGLDRGADQRAVRRAYRDRVKAVHPDADGGDEDEFRRVRAAYERLSGSRRGKG